VFAYVYHCLRIGELSGAIKELEGCIQYGLRSVEREILTCLQGFEATLRVSGSMSQLPPQEADTLVKVYVHIYV
jgi:hypothetical protein